MLPTASPRSTSSAERRPSKDMTLASVFHVPLVPSNLARPPVMWTLDEVKAWIRFCIQEFSLPPICLDKFNINGKALHLLTRADFIERAPEAGDVLYNAFSHLVRSNGSSLTYQCHQGSIRGPVYLSPVKDSSPPKEPTCSMAPRHAPPSFVSILPQPPLFRGNSGDGTKEDNLGLLQGVPNSILSPALTDKYSSDSDSSQTEPGPSPTAVLMDLDSTPNSLQVMTPQSPLHADPHESAECRLLWEFIYQLLMDEKYQEVVCWESEPELVFRINNPQNLAEQWGLQKHRTNMTYEKLSRALRYYYKMNIVRKVSGKKLTYQFLQHPTQIRRGQRGARPHSQRFSVSEEDSLFEPKTMPNQPPALLTSESHLMSNKPPSVSATPDSHLMSNKPPSVSKTPDSHLMSNKPLAVSATPDSHLMLNKPPALPATPDSSISPNHLEPSAPYIPVAPSDPCVYPTKLTSCQYGGPSMPSSVCDNKPELEREAVAMGTFKSDSSGVVDNSISLTQNTCKQLKEEAPQQMKLNPVIIKREAERQLQSVSSNSSVTDDALSKGRPSSCPCSQSSNSNQKCQKTKARTQPNSPISTVDRQIYPHLARILAAETESRTVGKSQDQNTSQKEARMDDTAGGPQKAETNGLSVVTTPNEKDSFKCIPQSPSMHQNCQVSSSFHGQIAGGPLDSPLCATSDCIQFNSSLHETVNKNYSNDNCSQTGSPPSLDCKFDPAPPCYPPPPPLPHPSQTHDPPLCCLPANQSHVPTKFHNDCIPGQESTILSSRDRLCLNNLEKPYSVCDNRLRKASCQASFAPPSIKSSVPSFTDPFTSFTKLPNQRSTHSNLYKPYPTQHPIPNVNDPAHTSHEYHEMKSLISCTRESRVSYQINDFFQYADPLPPKDIDINHCIPYPSNNHNTQYDIRSCDTCPPAMNDHGRSNNRGDLHNHHPMYYDSNSMPQGSDYKLKLPSPPPNPAMAYQSPCSVGAQEKPGGYIWEQDQPEDLSVKS